MAGRARRVRRYRRCLYRGCPLVLGPGGTAAWGSLRPWFGSGLRRAARQLWARLSAGGRRPCLRLGPAAHGWLLAVPLGGDAQMRPGPDLATFAFHEVTDDPTASGFQRPAALPYKHTRLAFAQHLASIGAGQLIPELVLEMDLERPGRHVLLSFDDGGESAAYVSDGRSPRGGGGGLL